MEMTLEDLKNVAMLLEKLNNVGKMLEMASLSNGDVEFSLGVSNQGDDFEALDLGSEFGVEILNEVRDQIVENLVSLGITIVG